MLGEVVADELADHLGRGEILGGTELLERLLLEGIDEERQTGGLLLHVSKAQKMVQNINM